MKLPEYYSHYFNNGGLCPRCTSLMTMHLGCTNEYCKDCKEHMEKDEIFSKRVMGAKRKKDKENERYDNLVKRIHARKKIDKCQEKKYANVEHS